MKLIGHLRNVSLVAAALLPACGEEVLTNDPCLVNLAPITVRTNVVGVAS